MAPLASSPALLVGKIYSTGRRRTSLCSYIAIAMDVHSYVYILIYIITHTHAFACMHFLHTCMYDCMHVRITCLQYIDIDVYSCPHSAAYTSSVLAD